MVHRTRVPSGLLFEIPRLREILPLMGLGPVSEPAEQEIGLSHLGIIAAVTAEARTLTRRPSKRRADLSVGRGHADCFGGGPNAGCQDFRALLESGATALLSWGSAGGLASRVSTGSLILPKTVIASDHPFITWTRLGMRDCAVG